MNKAELRVALLARRRQLDPGQRTLWSRAAQAHLLSTPLWQSARTVALYQPFRSEVSTALLMQAAWEAGKRVALPTTPPRGQPLRFREVSPDSPRVRGPLGTREPPPSCPELPTEEMDLVILPGLGWDRSGTRLGYGGGYYDRSFAGSGATRIQLAFGIQEQPSLPREPHDLPMHGVASEHGLRIL